MSNKELNYKIRIETELPDLQQKIKSVKEAMSTIIDSGKAPNASKIFEDLERALERMQQKAAQPVNSIAAFRSIQKVQRSLFLL